MTHEGSKETSGASHAFELLTNGPFVEIQEIKEIKEIRE
jgi:hypothetical protein